MDISFVDSVIALEKKHLQEERQRLHTARSAQSANQIDINVSAEELANNKTKQNLQSSNGNESPNNCNAVNDLNNNNNNNSSSNCAVTMSSAKSATHSSNAEDTFSLYAHCATDNELENVVAMPMVPALNLDFNEEDSGLELSSELSKSAKEFINQQALSSAKENAQEQKKHTKRNLENDDMDQWVSDTFYSYFPSFNNEYQKRQNYLRERQLENQQNYLKHQQQAKAKAKQQQKQTKTVSQQQPITTRSSSNSVTDKTDIEIIVNNPDYMPPKNNVTRTSATRNKLLQDLKHTDLSNIVSGDGVGERNRQTAELDSERKKNYHRELMQQIEEKRRTIERLRERERLQDEALTRRLEQQLKTIRLEEELEKEKMRQDRLLFDSAQNRLLRNHLLDKLEKDTRQLYSKKNVSNKTHEEDLSSDKNRVYQYFSNSARHEYRRGQPLPAEVEIDVELPERVKEVRPTEPGERECFHLIERVCPMCDAPLRNYQSSCLRCQRKLSMKMKVRRKAETQTQSKAACNGKENGNNNEKTSEKENGNEKQQQINANNADVSAAAKDSNCKVEITAEETIDTDADDVVVEDVRNYSLVCTKCERLYAMCSTCLLKSDVCRACHRKRNVCLNCRRTLCSFCLEEIASGRDIERTHVNEAECQSFRSCAQNVQRSNESAFQVLEVNYQAQEESDEYASLPTPENNKKYDDDEKFLPIRNANTSARIYGANLAKNHVMHNKLTEDKAGSSERIDAHLPYSMNIAQNSFNSNYSRKLNNMHDQQPAVAEVQHLLPKLESSDDHSDDIARLELLHKETERLLSRYFKNYGDLVERRGTGISHNCGTQTSPQTLLQRDKLLHIDQDLSMPLLREMPKIPRNVVNSQPAHGHKQSNIDKLKRRWEVPAVQKFSITSKSPRVLTQVGAIRKQLQAACLFDDETEEEEDS